MEISRRDLFRSAGVVGAVAAIGSLGGLASEAVAGTGPGTLQRAVATRASTLVKGPAAANGFRPVLRGPGEKYVLRDDLGVSAKHGRKKRRKGLVAFAQLSDVHICDSQSPARLDYLDRKDDDDNNDGQIDGGGTYRSAWRPHEILGAHVADAMIRQINALSTGPVTGRPLALAVQTGDNSDTSQFNEIRWNIDLLDGGEVRADSGDLTKFEGCMDNDPTTYDVRFWHPEGTPAGKEDDLPRTKYGFPVVPGLLDAARAPFQAEGLNMPWFTALGNHDPLWQGNFPADQATKDRAVGNQKQISPGVYRTVTADPDRRLLSKAEWVDAHFETTGLPVGHGFSEKNRTDETAYYYTDKGPMRLIVLDTVNAAGGQNGSLDKTQFHWLQSLLDATRHKVVVIASHHTAGTMDTANTSAADPRPRILGKQLVKELLQHNNVVAWVNGHTHTNNIWARKRKSGGGFWEINTASHIDWPQQARLVEIANNKDGTLSIFATMVDHDGPDAFDGTLDDPAQLAGLSRVLAANDWQEQGQDRRGARTARNVELIVRAPKFLR